MAATRLCRTDAGKLIDGLKDLSALLENLGLEDGSVRLTADGDIRGIFTLDKNVLEIIIGDDQKEEMVRYRVEFRGGGKCTVITYRTVSICSKSTRGTENAATDYMRNKPDVKSWQILNQRKRG